MMVSYVVQVREGESMAGDERWKAVFLAVKTVRQGYWE